MQESLKLIQIPSLDTSRLSTVGEFRRFVDRIERKYDMKLEFNDNARWRPGSYERLKTQVTHALFPHWSKPKGANTIRRLTKNCSYAVQQLGNELVSIDDKLRRFRQSKESLNSEDATKEGQILYQEYMTQLTKPVVGVDIDITSLPYWAKARRSQINGPARGIFEHAWDAPLHPSILSDGEIRTFTIPKIKVQQLYEVYNLNKNPKRWFVNIIIPLPNVNIEYFRGHVEERLMTTNHYGDLVVCFTVPIFDVVSNYRKIKIGAINKTHIRNVEQSLEQQYYSNQTFKFPYVQGIEHPFVQQGSSRYSYQWGNTCFGDFRNDVLMAISTGQMASLKMILRKWASTYHLGNTSPLNQPESHHLGMPKSWEGTIIPDYMGTNIELCRRSGIEESHLLENFCSNCALSEAHPKNTRPICEYYQVLIRGPIPMPADVNIKLSQLMKEVGLPGMNSSTHNSMEFKSVIQTMTEKLWNMVIQNSTCDILNVVELYKVVDYGNGGLSWSYFTDIFNNFKRNMSAPEEEMDYQGLARDAYLLFRYCERMYWIAPIAEFDGGRYENINDNYHGELSNAEMDLSIADLRMVVNTNRIANNQPLHKEYISVLLVEEITLEQEGDTNDQPF